MSFFFDAVREALDARDKNYGGVLSNLCNNTSYYTKKTDEDDDAPSTKKEVTKYTASLVGSYEDKNTGAIVIVYNAVGTNKDDITVYHSENGLLSVSYKRKSVYPDDSKIKYYNYAFGHTAEFSSVYELTDYDNKKTTVKLENGLLYISLFKKEEKKEEKIKINVC